MSRHESREILGAYGDGELDAVRKAEVETHLQQCSACSKIVAQDRAVAEAVALGARRFEAPAELQEQVMANLRAEGTERRVLDFPQKHKLTVWAIAAVLLMGSFVAGVMISRRAAGGDNILAEQIVASHVRSLMATHLADVASSDHHTVKPWFDGKLRFSPPVVDLAAEGFPLVGGRLDYFDQHSVAALVYRRDKHIINLFVWPTNETHESPPKGNTSSIDGYHLVRWAAADMSFCAVSDVELGELQQFATLVRARQLQ